MKHSLLEVREICVEDIGLIANYWTNSDPDFMVGMGVDLEKLPTAQQINESLTRQIETPYKGKQAYALIWWVDGQAIGHCNVNNIHFGKEATMHLHIWNNQHRQKGAGRVLVKRSLPYFFENLNLQQLICEPYALNPAPNKTLKSLGFVLEKTYKTIPGAINFEQDVNRWLLTKSKL